MSAGTRKCVVYRSERGKTIRLCITISDGKIAYATFTGDFFGEPAEEFQRLGELLVGLRVDDVDEMMRRIDSFFEKSVTWLAGASPEDFKQALRKILESL